MDSRLFISGTAAVVSRVERGEHNNSEESYESIRREIDRLFRGLDNPTLPSVDKLREAAGVAGIDVSRYEMARGWYAR